MHRARPELIRLSIFDCPVLVKSQSPRLTPLIRRLYAPFRTAGWLAPNPLAYHLVTAANAPKRFKLLQPGGFALQAKDIGHALFLLEKEITVSLQQRRPELLFLHASVLAYKGNAFLIAAPSGTGKSTTAWALTHEGFDYLSDELAPIDLDRMAVWPYPRAIGLKRKPPIYPLPRDSLHHSNGIHVPNANRAPRRPLPLRAAFFLSYDPELPASTVAALTPALATTHLYANTLNALAHAGMGLDACLRVAKAVPSYHLTTAKNLKGASTAIRQLLEAAN